MAIITSNVALTWSGLTTSSCENLAIANYRDSLNSVLVIEPAKSGLLTKSPLAAQFMDKAKNYTPGCSAVIFLKKDVNFEDVVAADVKKDSGRLVLTYVESFVTTGAEAGRYKMTTQFKNNKPVYILVGDVNWYIWYDAETSVWVCSRGDISKNGKYLQNESCLPQYGVYTNIEFSSYTQTAVNWNCVEISEFAGNVVSANGTYCQTGYYNSKPVYVSCDGLWYLFYDQTQWVLTDTPYTLEGRWITNSSTKVTTSFNGNGHNDFVNQEGIVKTLGVPDGSLKSEDNETFLFSEDSDTIITHE